MRSYPDDHIMPKLRFNIGSLLVIIFILGVGFAALRESSDLWESGLFFLMLGVLLISILLAVHRRESRRAFWIGFAVFGWTYLALTLIPSIEPRLITTKAHLLTSTPKFQGDRRYLMSANMKCFFSAVVATFLGCETAHAQHLRWNLEGRKHATCLYGEITVLATAPHIYYCGANWHPGEPAGGYCGIQHNSETERRTIFSIWDTSPQLYPKVTAANPHTIHNRFGGEGTGGIPISSWDWSVGDTVLIGDNHGLSFLRQRSLPLVTNHKGEHGFRIFDPSIRDHGKGFFPRNDQGLEPLIKLKVRRARFQVFAEEQVHAFGHHAQAIQTNREPGGCGRPGSRSPPQITVLPVPTGYASRCRPPLRTEGFSLERSTAHGMASPNKNPPFRSKAHILRIQSSADRLLTMRSNRAHYVDDRSGLACRIAKTAYSAESTKASSRDQSLQRTLTT